MDMFIRKCRAWFALHQARKERDRSMDLIYDQFDHHSKQGHLAYEKLARRIDEQYEQKRQEVLRCYGLSSVQNSED